MRKINVFNQRNMVQLKQKIKIIVLYSLKDYKEILNELKKECNTCICEYSIIPIYIGLSESVLSETNIKMLIRKHVSEYMKDLDIVCLFNSEITECDKYLIFQSVESFKIWFKKIKK